MGITRSEVLRIARLAQLRMDEAEAVVLAGELDRIVAYMDSLAGVELPDDDMESLTYFDRDVHREDRSGDCLDRADALENAPWTDGTYFVVPRIVDR